MLTVVSVVIGVIVSNLKGGLARLGKGVRGALKSIGKKKNWWNITRMAGTITSFLFQTAGLVMDF